MIRELLALQDKVHFRSLMIHDDCLTEDPAWVKAFCDRYGKAPLARPFVAQSRADLLCKDEEMLGRMKDVGLQMLIIGFESGSDRVLRFLRKGATLAQNLKAAELCHKYGIKIWANYMLGIPSETREEQFATLDMLRKIRPYHSSPAYYTPHPGSDLFAYGVEHDLHLPADHGVYRRNVYKPKIRGIDYVFLEKILRESIALAEDQQTLKGRIARYVPLGLRDRIQAIVQKARRLP